MRGGLVFFRGAGAAARAYLESDHSHADEYYLEHGGAVAQRAVLNSSRVVVSTEQLSGEQYQAWVDWKDPHTGEIRGVPREEVRVRGDGELRISQSSPRFVEMTVNCDKSLSVAAALDPAVSAALDDAQQAAVAAMNQYMVENSVTRVGPRDARRLVPAERLESVAVVHRTSRAGDPHRHVHLQWSTRVFAEGKWRGLWTGPTLKQQAALRGLGEAAQHSHAGLQAALGAAGFTFDPATGKVTNLAAQAELMSKRAGQIERNVTRLEGEWRYANPGREPDKTLRRAWDQQAWALERPRKRHTTGTAEQNWIDELRDAGLQTTGFDAREVALGTLREVDVDMVAAQVMATVQQRSAWSLADLEGAVGVAIGAAGVAAEPAELVAFQRRIADQIAHTLPRLETHITGDVPRWVRNVTSDHVLQVERSIRDRLTARGAQSGIGFGDNFQPIGKLNLQQSQGAVALASGTPLVVVQGVAGSGKTTMLKTAQDLAHTQQRRLFVVASTLRAAQEVTRGAGVPATSAHKLAYEYGYRWTQDNQWSRLSPGDVDPATGVVYDRPTAEYTLDHTSRVVVDEAGMIDQELGVVLLTIADETGAAIGLVGDLAQLSGPGRGGFMAIAVDACPRPIDLTEIHRFKDPDYAQLTLQMRDRRDPGGLFDTLLQRGNIVIHDSDARAWAGLTGVVSQQARAGAQVSVAAASNETATEINALVQDAHARAGHTRTAAVDVSGSDGLTLRIGDRVTTRRNDTHADVANRDIWTVTRVHPDGSVALADVDYPTRATAVSRDYVAEHMHLAYASTNYGIQGATVDYGHGILNDSTTAAGIYVPLTRGRYGNTLHVVADNVDDARRLFVDAMTREGGDRGVEHAREQVHRDLDGIILDRPEPAYDPQLRAERIAAEQRGHDYRMKAWERDLAQWQDRHPGQDPQAAAGTARRLERELGDHTTTVRELEHALQGQTDHHRRQQWVTDYAAVEHARAVIDQPGADRTAAAAAHERARDQFTATHGHAPVPVPPRQVRVQWQQAAIAPGADARLDAARRDLNATTRTLHQLRTDPVPTRPEPPRQGTPQQEALKDTRYRQWRDRAGRPAPDTTVRREQQLAEIQKRAATLQEAARRGVPDEPTGTGFTMSDVPTQAPQHRGPSIR